MEQRKKSKWIIIVLFGFLIIIITGWLSYQLFIPSIGENVDSCPYYNVPKEARNISYYHQFFAPCYAYEFHINEEDFLKWTKQRGYKVEKITNHKSFLIFTYKGLKNNKLYSHRKEISVGYKYEHKLKDTGVYVGYDKSSNRAYVFYHTR